MAFIGLAIIHDFMPAWLWWTVTVVVLLREWAVTFARLSIAKDVVMPAKQSGKVKTVMQVVALGGFIAPFGLPHRRPRRWPVTCIWWVSAVRSGGGGGADDHLRRGVRPGRRPPSARGARRRALSGPRVTGLRCCGPGRRARSRGCRSRTRRTAWSGCGRGRRPRRRSRRPRTVLRRSSSPVRTTSMSAIAASTAIRVASGASCGTAWMCQPRPSWSTSWGSASASVRIALSARHQRVLLQRPELAQPRTQRAYGVQLGRVAGPLAEPALLVEEARPGPPGCAACPRRIRAGSVLTSAAAAPSATSVSWAKVTLTPDVSILLE